MGWFDSVSARTKTKLTFLSGLRFRAKIMLGFATVLAISAVSMGVAYLGFDRISRGVVSYHDIVAQTDAARDIDRELTAYQLMVRYFVVTGSLADEAAARAAETELGKAIDRAGRVASAANRIEIQTLAASYGEFTKLFGEVVALKTENSDIAANQLLRMANFFRYRLDDIADTAALAGQTSLQSNAKETGSLLAAITANVGNYIVRPEKSVGNSVNARLQMIKGSMESLIGDEQVADKIKVVRDQLAAYQIAFNKYVQNTTAVDALTIKMNDVAGSITTQAKGVKDSLMWQQEQLANESSAVANNTGRFVTLLGIGGLIVGAILALMLGAGMSRPMIGMCAAMRELAAGKFDVVLPGLGRKDEIGEMANAVEEFKLQAIAKAERDAAERDTKNRSDSDARRSELNRFADDFETAVGGIVSSVSSSANQLEASAKTMTRTVETTQDMTGKVAGASEEASANVQSVASATEELSASVCEIGRHVQESSRIAAEAVAQAERTDHRITKLSEAAQRIGDVVKLITAIAEQTNLLALNATIEAARAGEAGRGFAVVASEVKSLASQTAKATDEISTQIAGMQQATQDSVTSIKEIGETIGQISRIAGTIAAAIEEQGSATQEIARNVQSVADGTHEIADSISEVNRGASETGAASGEVLNSAQTLAAESTRLRQELDRFMANIRAA